MPDKMLFVETFHFFIRHIVTKDQICVFVIPNFPIVRWNEKYVEVI